MLYFYNRTVFWKISCAAPIRIIWIIIIINSCTVLFVFKLLIFQYCNLITFAFIYLCRSVRKACCFRLNNFEIWSTFPSKVHDINLQRYICWKLEFGTRTHFLSYSVVDFYINTLKTIFLFKFWFLTSFFKLQVYNEKPLIDGFSWFPYDYVYPLPFIGFLSMLFESLLEIKNWNRKSSSLYWYIYHDGCRLSHCSYIA